jgi:hypothetical protein
MTFEYLQAPEQRDESLLTFVYDVPYIDACGMFPPLHILNQILTRGASGGGMSPGASWPPFTISVAEYEELWSNIELTNLNDVRARYNQIDFLRDTEFDQIELWTEWVPAICRKHRAAYERRLRASRTQD